MLLEHLYRIDGDKLTAAAGQDLTLPITNFRDIDVFAPANVFLAAFNGQGFSKGHRLEVFDLHLPRERNYLTEFVHLPHRLVKDGGDDAAVGMRRRADIARWELEPADKCPSRFVERELQPQSLWIIGTAAKTVVSRDPVVSSVVSGGGAFRGHIDQHATDERRRTSVAECEKQKGAVPLQAPPGREEQILRLEIVTAL
jgi:hypothetical protein